MPDAIDIKNADSEQHAFVLRALATFIGVTVLFAILLARMVQLQVIDHSEYSTRSEQNRVQVKPLPPPRGAIFDRNGVLLAGNRPISSLSIVTELIERPLPEVLDDIGGLIPVSEADLAAFHKRLDHKRHPFQPIDLKANLSHREQAVVAVNRHRLPGVHVRVGTVRHYPFAELTAHSVGSVRRIDQQDLERIDPVRYRATSFIGRRGIERFYEHSLHGEPGYKRVEIDVRGSERATLLETPPTAGHNLTLHLDVRIQEAASAALGDRRGAVVAIEPSTGGILAMVSKPGYDPNAFVAGMAADAYQELAESRDTPLFNRAAGGLYPPGSTFKPIIGLAAISLRLTGWSDTVNDPGWFKLENQERIYRDWSWERSDAGGQGVVDLHRAIYRSSNVYFYTLGARMDIDDLAGFASQFGYGRATALDVAGAATGLMPDSAWKRETKGGEWSAGDMVNLSIGQGDLLATPLQIATVAAVIANRGRWLRPRMLRAPAEDIVEFKGGDALPDIEGPSPTDWDKMVAAMEAVVHRGDRGYRQSGTAWTHIGRDIAYRMAGKSGTAQVVGIGQDEEYDEAKLDEYQRHHAWFMAFAPVDEPKIALAVMVENGGGGSSVAGVVARRILDAALLGTPPQLSFSPAPGSAANEESGGRVP